MKFTEFQKHSIQENWNWRGDMLQGTPRVCKLGAQRMWSQQPVGKPGFEHPCRLLRKNYPRARAVSATHVTSAAKYCRMRIDNIFNPK